MRLDHLLSKEEEVGIVLLFSCQWQHKIAGVDALMGNTRSHLEHDG